MTAVAMESVPHGAVRVYLVPAEEVAEFFDLLREAEAAGEDDSTADPAEAWSRVGQHVAEVFSASKVVRAKFN
jgi:hypothetical protein